MGDILQTQRTVKVFVASPSDVVQERAALARLVRDINDVLAFLAPNSNLHLELVGYETHSYPDIGSPQEVINRQIPLDYDIFIGIMWKRCGTPTKSAPSGTIEEFRRACEKRKQGGLPRIMFYFCDEHVAVPDLDELMQLTEVIKFRSELATLGLTSTYPSHAEFSEYVRGGLLRAIRDLLLKELSSENENTGSLGTAKSASGLEVESSPLWNDMTGLAEEYEAIRAAMPSGSDRTRRMEAIFSRMKTIAANVRGFLGDLKNSPSPGRRLAAIAILHMFPDTNSLDWLALRLDNPEVEKPFVGYQAAVALLEAVRALPPGERPAALAAVAKAKKLAKKLPQDSDRIRVLETAEAELLTKHADRLS